MEGLRLVTGETDEDLLHGTVDGLGERNPRYQLLQPRNQPPPEDVGREQPDQVEDEDGQQYREDGNTPADRRGYQLEELFLGVGQPQRAEPLPPPKVEAQMLQIRAAGLRRKT